MANAKQIIIGLNSKTNAEPRFLKEGTRVDSKLLNFDCYFYNGSFYWVENGKSGYKQEDEDIVPVVYAIRPGTDRLTYGSATHWDRHPAQKELVTTFVRAENAIASHYEQWNPMPEALRPCDSRSLAH